MNFVNLLKSKKKLIGIILSVIIIGITAFLDITLAVGTILVGLLTLITFLVLFKIGMKSKALILLLVITFLIHFGVVLFIHYADFQPFSGGDGDYRVYDNSAKIIAERIHQGNFSLKDLPTNNFYYPIIMGYVYALTVPEMFIGQLLDVWLAVISVLLVYLIVLEIGGSKKQALLTGLLLCFYPSYLFFGSLLLKDTLVVPLVLGVLLFGLKLIKNFSWRNFVIFYIILWLMIHFRFYVGYALIMAFIPCWLMLCKLALKKRIIYGIIMIVLIGFLPQFYGSGYYGFNNLKYFINPKMITSYRELTYSSSPLQVTEASESETPKTETNKADTPKTETNKEETPKTETNKLITKIFPNVEKAPSSSSSTIQVKTEINKPINFLINWSKSFIHILLGPLPWQIQNYRQLFTLLETIPWYFLMFFIIKGAFVAIRQKHIALLLLVFSIISLGVLALFVPNFGLTTRIRIPSFIALLCLIPLGFEKSRDIKISFLNNLDKYLDKYII